MPMSSGCWALKEAIADCGPEFDDIDGLIVNRIPDYQRFCEIAGLNPAYVSITPGQGRFSGICIETAAALIRGGARDDCRSRLRQQRPLWRRPLWRSRATPTAVAAAVCGFPTA